MKKSKGHRAYTPEERATFLTTVDAVVKGGGTLSEGVKAAGGKMSNYYQWKKKSKPAKISRKRVVKEAQLMTLHVPSDEQQLVILIGKSEAVVASLQRLVELR